MSIEPKQTRTIIITGANNYTCHAKIHTHTHTQAFSLFGFKFFYIVFSFYIIIFVVCLSEINFILFYCFQKIVCQYFLPTTSTTTTTYYYNILSYSSSCLRSLSLLPILSFPFFFLRCRFSFDVSGDCIWMCGKWGVLKWTDDSTQIICCCCETTDLYICTATRPTRLVQDTAKHICYMYLYSYYIIYDNALRVACDDVQRKA